VTLTPTEDFAHALHGYARAYFRLETLQSYRGSGEDAWPAAFRRGEPAPPHDVEQDEWETILRRHRDAGHLMQRVHVIVQPLTDYLRFELAWMYALNVACGERIGIVDATSGWPSGVPRGDFHLFDDALLFVADYSSDGTWLGVTRVDDMRKIEAARRGRDAALHHAQPWETFIADRPDLAARLPRATTG
jgi:hypothetical protein